MAMRQGFGGLRPQAVARPTYENFKPMSDWKHEEDSDILVIHLPGFMKEYLKVTTEGRNIIRVRGERSLSINKRSRFQEDFQIPEQCDMTQIRAKFEGGTLNITMPRKIGVITQSAGQKGENQTTQASPSPQKTEPKPTLPSPNNAPTYQKPQKRDDETPPTGKQQNKKTESSPSAENVAQQNKDGEKIKEVETLKERKENLETKGKYSESNISQKSVVENDATEEKNYRSPRIKEPEMPKEMKEKMETKARPSVSEISQKVVEKAVVEEKKNIDAKIPRERKESIKTMESDPTESKLAHKEIEKATVEDENKTTIEKTKELISEVKKKTKKKSTSSKDKMGKKSEAQDELKNSKQVVSEERELMVNMGVAVLVIVAFGFYVYYTFRSSGNVTH